MTLLVFIEHVGLSIAIWATARVVLTPCPFFLVKTEELNNIPGEWLEEFKAAARRSLETRLRYAFIHTYKPVLDDAPYRAFETMEDYRRWCEEELPDWLGYGRV
jgi:hypothetical protein